MSNLYSNSIFWIEVEKINPNPYQPRREFDEAALRDLADSIRQYGILQPLVVSRVEREKEDGGFFVEYELIAGERRLRASKLAGVAQVPVIIRTGDDSMMKLEIAIIENLQREDLNPVDRARAFLRLVEEFKFTHTQIGQKMGKSREYVSNSLRLLALPGEMLDALSEKKITEGHTRPLMMLSTRPDEQMVLFKEILYRKITVREAERIARNIATEKARKKELLPDPEILEMEKKIRDTLGTRVHIERKNVGGQIMIDFFSPEDLKTIISVIETLPAPEQTMLDSFIEQQKSESNVSFAMQEPTPSETETPAIENSSESTEQSAPSEDQVITELVADMENETDFLDDRSQQEITQSETDTDTDMYNIKNFSL